MFRFGYDFFDSKTSTMKRPNGARFNKQIIGETCHFIYHLGGESCCLM